MDELEDGVLVEDASKKNLMRLHSGPILEGSRNKTLDYAGRILKIRSQG